MDIDIKVNAIILINMKIFYGINNIKIDVTDICTTKLMDANGIITIPESDVQRAAYFTDPFVGMYKKIFIENMEFDHFCSVQIDLKRNAVTSVFRTHDLKLQSIQFRLKLKYGSFKDEYPEQLMATRFLKGDEKVLEIGGNIGRNSLVIASILKNQSDLVVMESDSNIAQQLRENRAINGMSFHIEASALSQRKLIQRGWDTIPYDGEVQGFFQVPIINIDQLNAKYNIVFDTLVLDCEGAFYYILKDMPQILQNINMIIMENDYKDIEHKKYIDEVLKNNNMSVIFSQEGGWGACQKFFFEVWKKN